MLPSVEILSSNILALTPTIDAVAGMTSFSGVIAAFMANAQGGPTGTPGIFTLDTATLIPLLAALPPVSDSSWISGFCDAFEVAVTASIITPGTVTNPAWTTSAVDIATLPSAAATITTISVAKSTLMAALASAVAGNNPAIPFAQAISEATLAFIFTCIGLGPLGVPIPMPTPAE